MNEMIFNNWFIIIPIIIIAITFIIVIATIASPKMRGKMMARQIKAAKYMLDEAEDDLRDITTKAAQASQSGLNIASGAVKDGFTSGPKFCKYCSESNDEDAIYCKRCGKKQ